MTFLEKEKILIAYEVLKKMEKKSHKKIIQSL